MSPLTPPTTEFERNAVTVLEASVARIDARTRSRLNQARQTALEAAGGRRSRPWWRSFALMPAGAVAAALLVAVMLWHREPAMRETPPLEGHVAAVEDMDLLADAEGLDLIEGWDGPFYEWAADQSDANVQSES
jgi:cytochrome c-type biogenesis protein CcmH/NrfG